jgi:DNA-binding transcriptional MerR regulator/methylmalonyl-CoA mutase cobalamin-binding subunit
MSEKKEHPIAVVARRTGLTAHVIRKWEQRYHVVAPSRSRGGRRLYSENDIHRLILLRRVVQSGRAIGQIAGLSEEKLREFLGAETGDDVTHPPSLEEVIGKSIDAAMRLDERELNNVLRLAAVDLGQNTVVEYLVPALMTRIGDLWQRGILRVVQEHLATAVVGSYLSQQLESINLPDSAPIALVATAAEQHHDLGARIAAVVAASAGWHAIFAGSNIPVEEIANAANSLKADIVLLGYTYPRDSRRLIADLVDLRSYVSDDVYIVAGGAAMAKIEFDSLPERVLPVRDFPELRELLLRLSRNR